MISLVQALGDPPLRLVPSVVSVIKSFPVLLPGFQGRAQSNQAFRLLMCQAVGVLSLLGVYQQS